jgi:hypothetical protein
MECTRRLYACCYPGETHPVPAMFSLSRLAGFAADRRSGRPVYMGTLRTGPTWARAWVAGQDADWIICRQDVPWRERMWFTAHQAAHMLLRHAGESVSSSQFAELLFPGLDCALGRRDGGATAVTFGFATAGEEYQALAVTMEVIGAAGTYHTSRSARNSMIT